MLREWYTRVFGMRPAAAATLPPLDGDRGITLDTPTGQMQWQLVEPSGAGSRLRTFIDERGPGLHHVAFEVGDWERTLAACAHHGIAISAERAGEAEGTKWRDAFIGPEETGGFLTRLIWRADPVVK